MVLSSLIYPVNQVTRQPGECMTNTLHAPIIPHLEKFEMWLTVQQLVGKFSAACSQSRQTAFNMEKQWLCLTCHYKIVLYITTCTSKQARGERTNSRNKENIPLFAYDQFLRHMIWHLNSGYHWISQNSTMVTIYIFRNEKEVLSNSLDLEPGW